MKSINKAILKEYFRCETLDYYDCLKFGGIIVSAFCARNAELSIFDDLAYVIEYFEL